MVLNDIYEGEWKMWIMVWYELNVIVMCELLLKEFFWVGWLVVLLV